MPPKCRIVAVMDNSHFDRWAVTYERSLTQMFFFNRVHSAMLRLVACNGKGVEPSSVLDLGCGTGRLLRRVSRLWPGARLFGVDLSPVMIGQASRLAPDAGFFVSPAEEVPVPDASIDLVLTSVSFHHWRDQAKGLSEVMRVLRPGGVFCIADQTMPKWIARHMGSNTNTRKELRARIGKAGFVSIVSRPSVYPWIEITRCEKPTTVAVHRDAG
jgi:ubiquinone/menaquinone biosynthesis C-methylase UbiE